MPPNARDHRKNSFNPIRLIALAICTALSLLAACDQSTTSGSGEISASDTVSAVPVEVAAQVPVRDYVEIIESVKDVGQSYEKTWANLLNEPGVNNPSLLGDDELARRYMECAMI